jgi:hypothetical protein
MTGDHTGFGMVDHATPPKYLVCPSMVRVLYRKLVFGSLEGLKLLGIS